MKYSKARDSISTLVRTNVPVPSRNSLVQRLFAVFLFACLAVVSGQAAADTLILHPSGSASGDDLSYSNGNAATALDDASLHYGTLDDKDGEQARLQLDPLSLSGFDPAVLNSTINSVRIVAVVRDLDGDEDDQIRIGVRTNGSDRWGSDINNVSTSYTPYSGTPYVTNPVIGGAWTWQQIADLVALVENREDKSKYRIAELYAEVVHTDATPPAAITDLSAGTPTQTSIPLTWAAPGDDGNSGTASSYDIRYSTALITNANWASATQVTGEPTAQVAGTAQNYTVTGLASGQTYYFAIKTTDEVPNTSALSNVLSRATVAPVVNFSPATQSAGEAAGTASVTVSLSNAAAQASGSSTATLGSGNDYTLSPASPLSIPAGQTSATITVTLNNDTLDEADESVILTLGTPTGGATLGTTPQHTLTITDNDAPPTVGFAATASSGAESLTSVNLAVNLSGASGRAVSVNYAVSGGDATAGSDYTLAAGTVNFAAGETTQDIVLSVIDDLINEGDETVAVTLSGPVNAGLGTPTHTYTINDNDDSLPTVEFVLVESSGSEGNTPVTVGVSLSATSQQSVNVDYSVVGGTAITGTDYILSNGTLTFAPGQDVQLISFSVTNDLFNEDDETLSIELSNPTNANLGATVSHTFTIIDNDNPPAVQFDAASAAASENVTNVTIPVSLTVASGRVITVNYAATAGSADAGSDYTLSAGTLTFNPGDTTQTIALQVIEDPAQESNETVVIDLSSPTNAGLGARARHTYTIQDNDSAPTVSFALGTANGNEDSSPVAVEVVLSAASGQTVTVGYAASTTGTAIAGSDYTLTAGTLSFAPGETSQTFNLNISEDALDEVDETVELALSNPVNAQLGTALHTYTIIDNDAAPDVSFDAAAQQVSENVGGSLNLILRLSAVSAKAVTVPFTVSGTATAGSDYTIVTAGDVSIPAGVDSGSITIDILDDMTSEGNETVVVSLGSPTNATAVAPIAHTLTIIDDDDAPVVSFRTTVSSGSENISPVLIEVVLSAASAQTVTVDYAVTGGTANAEDYSPTGGTLSFAPGDTSKTFNFNVNEDLVHEGDETVVLTLSNAVNANVGTAQHTYTIEDDEAAPVVSFSALSQDRSEDAGPVTVTVNLSNASSQAISVPYTISGSATIGSGNDYTVSSISPLSIAAGQTNATLTVTINDDELDEVDETAILTLGTPSGDATLGIPSVHTLTIIDNEALPTVAFVSASQSVAEDAGEVLLEVTLSAATSRDVTVPYSAANGSAAQGSDYTLAGGPLVIPAGATSGTIAINVIADSLDEVDETIVINLAGVTNAALVDPMQHTLTLIDIDATPTVGFAVLSGEGVESVSTVSVEVKLSASSGREVRVDFAADANDVNSTAQTGEDYSLTPGTLTFSPGETTKSITLTIVDNEVVEDDESVVLVLSNAVNADMAGSRYIHTIRDDETVPSVSFNTISGSGAESVDTVAIEVALSVASTQVVTVDYAVTGSATADADYTLASGTLTFNPGDTSKVIDLTVIDDEDIEDSEDVLITLSAPSNANLGVNTQFSYTITDNDQSTAPQVSIVATDPNAAEVGEDPGLFTISRSGSTEAPLTVSFEVLAGDGQATPGSDYTLWLVDAGDPQSATELTGAQVEITLPAGAASAAIQVRPIDDNELNEPNEQVTLQLLASSDDSYQLGATASATVLITFDNTPVVSIEPGPGVVTAREDAGAVTITLRRTGDTSEALTVFYLTAGTAVSGEDYISLPDDFIIPANASSATFTLSIVDDATAEASENIVIILDAFFGGPYQLSDDQDVTEILIRDNDDTTVIVSAADDFVSENSTTPGLFTIARFGDLSQDITVGLDSDGTALVGRDFDPPLPSQVALAAGIAATTLDLNMTDNAVQDGPRTVTVSVRVGENYLVGTPGSATITIIDDDGTFPEANFDLDQIVEEGDTAIVRVRLSRAADSYPVRIPYTFSGSASEGSDYEVLSEDLLIESGTLGEIAVVTIKEQNVEVFDETLTFAMGEPVNARIGGKRTHTVTISENNIAPRVMLTAAQAGQPTRRIVAGSGPVTVTASVFDANRADTHTFDWSRTNNSLQPTTFEVVDTFVFDPAGLAPGQYKVRVAVTDSHRSPKATEVDVQLEVVFDLDALQVTDSDTDSMLDDEEGHGDTDQDGIPNYQDDNRLGAHQLQQQILNSKLFLMQTLPGLSLRVGEVAQAAERRGAEVTTQEISRFGAGEASPGVNAGDNATNFGGYYDVQIQGLTVAAMAVPLAITLTEAIPVDAVFRIYKPIVGWQDFVVNPTNKLQSAPASDAGLCPAPLDARYVDGLQEGHQCVQLIIQDGGPNDSDGTVNYAIKSLTGVAVIKEVAGSDAVRSPCGDLICSSSSRGGGNTGPLSLMLLVLMWSARRYAGWRGRVM